MIFAILRAQLLSMRSFRLGSSRRGKILSILTALIWYGVWAGFAVALEQVTANPRFKHEIAIGFPRGLLVVFLYWQLAPVASASMGAALDLRKLLAYPIPHRRMFAIEVMLRLTTCAEMLLILGGALVGLLRNPAFGGLTALPRYLLAFGLFTVFNLLLAAGVRSLLERLLSRRHLREVFVFVLVMLAALPHLLVTAGVRMKGLEKLFFAGQGSLWPWAATSHVTLGEGIAQGLLALASWTLLAYLFGRWQFERSLRFDVSAEQATTPPHPGFRESWPARLFRLPSHFLPDPIAAIVEKELRSLSRTPRFRLVFIMGFTFGILIWFPLALGRQSAGPSSLEENFLILVSVYALTLLGQVSYWNTFGLDRSAVQLYFSLPIPIAKTFIGKNIAACLFIFLEVAAVTGACLVLRMHIAATKILETFIVIPIAALYMLAMGNLASVHYPRPIHPERVSQGSAASRFQALIFIFYPIALLPVFLAYLARAVLDSEAAFWLILTFAGALGVIVYWIAMDSAVAATRSRRETIVAELSRTDGPVVSD